MKKRLAVIFLSLFAFTLGVIGFSAFEAHVINITATIENAVAVDTDQIDFGTVFPQEMYDESFTVELSSSFLAQDRAQEVDYVLRQKPKCWSENLQIYGRVIEDQDGNFVCADEGDFTILPLLCPYLSKSETTEDGPQENDGDPILPFHGPIGSWTMADTLAHQAQGRLVLDSDPNDTWLIDLKVPCFEGACAQDWPEFVLAHNPNANPDDYILPDIGTVKLGCDLWLEVTGIEEYDGQGGPDCVPEVCDDQIDNDCDALVDCDDPDCDSDPICNIIPLCIDIDGDGYGTSNDQFGCPYDGVDCDDTMIEVNPGATEVCDDSLDNDCDLAVDCQDSDCDLDPACEVAPFCVDTDGDGYGDAPGQVGCPYDGVDCDDAQIGINPGALEICDGQDNDCDTTIDEDWPTLGDACSVGQGICQSAGVYVCNAQNPAGIAICDATAGDPETEQCTDTFDNDCDGFIDCFDDDCSADPACTSVQVGDVLINEVAWMGTSNSTSDEWIELRNTTSAVIDLTNWTLDAQDGTPGISLSGSIPANGYFLLERTDDTTVPGVAADQIYTGTLENGGEVLELFDSGSNLIDTADGGSGWPAGDSASKRTMERCVDLSWHTSAVVDGSPKAVNSACANTIAFTDTGASGQYGYDHDYSNASASFTYNTVGDDTITGTVTGTGLKPYFTYQLKFEATPTCIDAGTGDNQENEDIGLIGRWWNNTTSSNLNDTPVNNDAYYLANSDYYTGTECIQGYLVWGYATADASGNINKAVTTDNSYHVLRCNGGTCGLVSDTQLVTGLDPGYPSLQLCSMSDVEGEIERSTCTNNTLLPGDYSLKMILNEESFHLGTWTAVMNSDINFSIY